MIRIFLIIIQKLCFRSYPSERSNSHAKYSGVLTASSPESSLVMLCWICFQVFSFCFSCLTTLAGANHVKYKPYMCRFFSGQRARGKRQIRTDPFSSLMVTHKQFATQCHLHSWHRALSRCCKGEDGHGVLDNHHAWHLSSASHYLPSASAAFNLAHVHQQMDLWWVTSSVFMSLLNNMNSTEGTGICSVSVSSVFSSVFSPATWTTFLKKY